MNEAAAAAERAARTAYGKLVAAIARRTGDITAAEDALATAFARALTHWPKSGVPAAPQAWLLSVARNAAIDTARRRATETNDTATLTLLAEEHHMAKPDHDPRLGLVLAASHPAIAPEVRAPLILQTVFGVSAHDIAEAYLIPPATLSQRLVRAKAKIKAAKIPFEPDPDDAPTRLANARDAVFALYTVARAAPRDEVANARAGDALAIATLCAERLPDDPETLGLAALIAFSEARQPAARDGSGRYIKLSDQNVGLWDAALLTTAERWLASAAAHRTLGRFQIMAAIQSAHSARRHTGTTPWAEIAAFYDVLLAMMPTAGVATARAAAHGNAFGKPAGLGALEDARTGKLCPDNYQPYWALRAHLCEGEDSEIAYTTAIALSRDEVVRAHLSALAEGSGHKRH